MACACYNAIPTSLSEISRPSYRHQLHGFLAPTGCSCGPYTVLRPIQNLGSFAGTFVLYAINV